MGGKEGGVNCPMKLNHLRGASPRLSTQTGPDATGLISVTADVGRVANMASDTCMPVSATWRACLHASQRGEIAEVSALKSLEMIGIHTVQYD